MLKKAVILFLLSLSVFARAEGNRFLLSRLDLSDGLSDNCVNDVLTDSRQLVWIGTNEGLDVYDGRTIVHVAFPEVENAVQPVVFTLAEDASGTIWAGTSSGLFQIRTGERQMKPVPSPDLEGSGIRKMCFSASGTLWMAIGKDLISVRPDSGETECFPGLGTFICRTPDGALYSITNKGDLLFSANGSEAPAIVFPEQREILSGLDISRIMYAGEHIFITETSGNSYALSLQEKTLRPLPTMQRIRDAILGEDGLFYLAARDGIHVLDADLEEKPILRPLSDNSFRCLTEDSRGGIWAGTLFEGLVHLEADDLHLRHYSNDFAGGSFKARDFAETPDGRIWIGSDSRGLLCLDPGDGRCSRTFFERRNITGLMAEGSLLWVGTIDGELPVARLDTESGAIEFFPEAGNSAYAFCRDTTGRLWIGGGEGYLAGRELPGGHFERELYIPTKQISRIICTADGSVWVASINGQVYRHSPSDVTTYKIPTANILTDIYEDRQGRVFAISEGGGLWEYHAADDRFSPLSGTESRLLKMAGEKASSLLWITGAHGLQILNPEDGRPLPLLTLEALGIDSFNYASNFIASDGTLYAGTSDGFISFSERQMSRPGGSLRRPFISSFSILSSPERTDGGPLLFPTALNLGRSTRSFEIKASPLDYTRLPREIIYWKIDGFSDWAPVKAGTFDVYDIPSGKWKLRLKTLSVSGEESEETTLDLRVKPHLLLSPVAFILYILLFLLASAVAAIVSDRHAKEKAEREHERRLLESKMEFLTSIAHEIRTPLSLVQIPLEALIRKFSSSADGSVQENLDIMRRNSLKLTVLINELLDFRKLTDSTFQIHPEFLDLRGILKDAHRRFLPTFMQEGKTLSISIPDTAVYCETDVRSVGRIFDNLLSNALKYSRHHSSVTLSVSGHDAVVSVENDGAVLPEDVRELIFQPFYRYEDSASANVEGTGLGLSTSRQFASLLGGSLSMDDDLKVNRFLFTLPVSSAKESVGDLPVVETKDKSVMVVEDDKDMSRVIGDILSESYNIVYASNGREALEKIEAGASPTLVVSDVIMPETDGIALTRALKGNLATSHIPVILLSAEVPDVFMQESLEGGADAYLEKPFSPKKLRSTVDNLIENRKRVYEFYVSSLPSDGELPTGRVSAQEQKFLRSIQEYVNANLHRSITLDDLAEVVCLSPSTLYKKMKDYADVSPMEYVMKVRLHRAVELLKDDSVSVQEVAQSVGFNTHSFFSECFKREFGMTPRQWRTRNVAKTVK